MKLIFSFVLLHFVFVVNAQNFSYPQFPKTAAKIDDLIPKGWMILDSVTGDLNKDKIPDLVLVVQAKDSVKMVKFNGTDFDTVKTCPRIIGVFVFNPTEALYKLSAQNSRLVISHDDQQMDDPFTDISIEKGILTIKFTFWYASGTWYVTNLSYSYEFRDNTFQLVKALNRSVHRSTSDFANYDYNFDNKRCNLTKGNDKKPAEIVKELYKIDLIEPKTLDAMKEPLTWQIIKNIYL